MNQSISCTSIFIKGLSHYVCETIFQRGLAVYGIYGHKAISKMQLHNKERTYRDDQNNNATINNSQ